MQETAGTTITPFNPTDMAFNQVASATSAATNNYRYDTIELTLTERRALGRRRRPHQHRAVRHADRVVGQRTDPRLPAQRRRRADRPGDRRRHERASRPPASRMARGQPAARRCHRRPTIAKPTWAATTATAPVAQRAEQRRRLEFLRPGSRPGRPAHPHRQFLSRRRQDCDCARGRPVLRLLRRELRRPRRHDDADQ